MEQYENIMNELNSIIAEYKDNLVSLRAKFEDIKAIIDNLERMKNQASKTTEEISELEKK